VGNVNINININNAECPDSYYMDKDDEEIIPPRRKSKNWQKVSNYFMGLKTLTEYRTKSISNAVSIHYITLLG
jgi:hypothetical protein